jgi:hypothetical protein
LLISNINAAYGNGFGGLILWSKYGYDLIKLGFGAIVQNGHCGGVRKVMKALITGAAGFIGYHLSEKLLAGGHSVCGIDNLNDYYDVSLKTTRLKRLEAYDNFKFVRLDIGQDAEGLNQAVKDFEPTVVVNLAAQAGVR